MNRPFDDFVGACRDMVRPVDHLTDAEIVASELEPPLVRLLLDMRRHLREFDAAEAAARSQE